MLNGVYERGVMTYTFPEILSFITYGVVSVAGLLLIVVLIRLYFVLGLMREVLKRVIFHRSSIAETLTQIRLFCEKFIRDPAE